jgi:hypothetical protein
MRTIPEIHKAIQSVSPTRSYKEAKEKIDAILTPEEVSLMGGFHAKNNERSLLLRMLYEEGRITQEEYDTEANRMRLERIATLEGTNEDNTRDS